MIYKFYLSQICILWSSQSNVYLAVSDSITGLSVEGMSAIRHDNC